MVPAVKVAILWVPVAPMGPLIRNFPPGSRLNLLSTKLTLIPVLSKATYRFMIRFITIWPKASVTMAR